MAWLWDFRRKKVTFKERWMVWHDIKTKPIAQYPFAQLQHFFYSQSNLWASASVPADSMPLTQSPKKEVGTLMLWPQNSHVWCTTCPTHSNNTHGFQAHMWLSLIREGWVDVAGIHTEQLLKAMPWHSFPHHPIINTLTLSSLFQPSRNKLGWGHNMVHLSFSLETVVATLSVHWQKPLNHYR